MWGVYTRRVARQITDELLLRKIPKLARLLPQAAGDSVIARAATLQAERALKDARERLAWLPTQLWGAPQQSVQPPLYMLQKLVSSFRRCFSRAAYTPQGEEGYFLLAIDGVLVDASRITPNSISSVVVHYPPPEVPLGPFIQHEYYGTALSKAFTFVLRSSSRPQPDVSLAYTFPPPFPSPCSRKTDFSSSNQQQEYQQQQQQPTCPRGAQCDAAGGRPSLPKYHNPFEDCTGPPGHAAAAGRSAAAAPAAPVAAATREGSEGAATSASAAGAAAAGTAHSSRGDFASERVESYPGADINLRETLDTAVNSDAEAETSPDVARLQALLEEEYKDEAAAAAAVAAAGGSAAAGSAKASAGLTMRKLQQQQQQHLQQQQQDEEQAFAPPDCGYEENDQGKKEESNAMGSSSSTHRRFVQQHERDLRGLLQQQQLQQEREPPAPIDAEEIWGEEVESDHAASSSQKNEKGETGTDVQEAVLVVYVGSRASGSPLSDGDASMDVVERRQKLLQAAATKLLARLTHRSVALDGRQGDIGVRAFLVSLRREQRLQQLPTWALSYSERRLQSLGVRLHVGFGDAPLLLLPLSPFFT